MNNKESLLIKTLKTAATSALNNSYAPYSHFHVAAAALGASGKVYTGVNVENASYPAGICAERNAIFHAVAEGEKEIEAILITGCDENGKQAYCPPCGVCRQVMREFADPKKLKVIVCSEEGEKIYTLEDLLPDSFGPEKLQV
ncbi:MAG: cytidine deaminase [Lachnospiraceae bacterium]|nr:cytidine deaminase [Lachnospiraceae bacterium]